MKLWHLIFCAALIIFPCCSSPSLLIMNKGESEVYLQFQTPAKDDPSNPISFFTADTSISMPLKATYEQDLILIKYHFGKTPEQKYIRVSESYLASKNWKLEIPFPAIDTVRFVKREFIDELTVLRNGSYYHFMQDLFNSGKYFECLYAFESISPSAFKVIMSSGHGAEVRGMVTMCFLSAHKIHDRLQEEKYWNLLSGALDAYTRFLREHDLEVSQMPR